MAKEEAQAKVTFVTSIVKGKSNYWVILKHGTPIYDAGVRIGIKRPVFADFKNGKYETDNPEYIAKLRGLSSFGRDFYEATGREEPKVETTAPAENLNSKTKPQLIAIAKERKLPVKEGMTKLALLELLK